MSVFKPHRSLLVVLALGLVTGLGTAGTPEGPITVCPSGCDYRSIQAAIDAAQPEDKIEVSATGSPYREVLTIKTPDLWLQATEGRVVIDGGEAEVVVTILADGVDFEGFEVQGGSVGIAIEDAYDVSLRANVLATLGDGPMIRLVRASRGSLEGNQLIPPERWLISYGIALSDSEEMTLYRNTVKWASTAFSLERSQRNRIKNNLVLSQIEGIHLVNSQNNLLEGNIIDGDGGQAGIWLESSSSNVLRGNRVHGFVGGIVLFDSHENPIEENETTAGHIGIHLKDSHRNLLRRNSGDLNILLWGANDNLILENTVESGEAALIDVTGARNLIRGNRLLGRDYHLPGISLSGEANVVTGNLVMGVDIGLKLEKAHTNAIYDNVFQGNRIGVKVGSDALSNMIKLNEIFGNQEFGLMNAALEGTVDARFNWWGDPRGPYHPKLNPTGQGDRVSDGVEFVPWLENPVRWCD